MKSGIIAVVLAGIFVVVGIMYSFIREKHKPVDNVTAVAARPNESSKVVHVDELAKNPENFKGEIVLRGVVAGVKESEGIFGIVDCREFQVEGIICPDDVILPVRFSGDLPKPKAMVEITGQVIRDKNGLIIEAKRVEVMQ